MRKKNYRKQKGASNGEVRMSDEWRRVNLKGNSGMANGGGEALDVENYDIAEWLKSAITRRLCDIQTHPNVAFIFKGKHRIYKVTSGNRSHCILIQYKERFSNVGDD